jgi:hypothetical protein
MKGRDIAIIGALVALAFWSKKRVEAVPAEPAVEPVPEPTPAEAAQQEVEAIIAGAGAVEPVLKPASVEAVQQEAAVRAAIGAEPSSVAEELAYEAHVYTATEAYKLEAQRLNEQGDKAGELYVRGTMSFQYFPYTAYWGEQRRAVYNCPNWSCVYYTILNIWKQDTEMWQGSGAWERYPQYQETFDKWWQRMVEDIKTNLGLSYLKNYDAPV